MNKQIDVTIREKLNELEGKIDKRMEMKFKIEIHSLEEKFEKGLKKKLEKLKKKIIIQRK